MMLFRPPRMPWVMVGARTIRPRTTPLYSRMRRPCMSNVVETMIEDRMAIGRSLVDGGNDEPGHWSLRPDRLACTAGLQVSSDRSMAQPLAVQPSATPSLARSLIGMKAIMATSGVILFLFVVGHLLGNLKVFQGPEHFNAYAEGLRTVGAPLLGRGQLRWVVRGVLLLALGAHIWAAIAVTRASWRARPIGYQRLESTHTTYAARTMRWGGVIILLYVIYHLLDFTFGRVNPSFIPADAYHNVVASFRLWPVAAFYGVAMVVVGLHVYHGVWSALQTLGLHRAPTERWRRGAAGVIAAAIVAGYVAIPAAVLAGWLR